MEHSRKKAREEAAWHYDDEASHAAAAAVAAAIPTALALDPVQQPSSGLSPALMRQYLLTPAEHRQDLTVRILNPRVVQRSYGTEKRFFCPSPCVILSGAGWLDPSKGSPYVFISLGDQSYNHQKIDLDENLFGAARNLFISDQDRRKSFCLEIKIFHENQFDVGTFESKPLKVISKPSKKKQTQVNSDMCVESGSTIGLFNRLRAQANSTRFIFTKDGRLIADSRRWSPYRICIYPPPEANPSAMDNPIVIHYDMDVTLQCMLTGWQSPVYTIRKAEKNQAFLNVPPEALTQLQKVAFQLKERPTEYLTMCDENVQLQTVQRDHKDFDSIPDGAAWTLSSSDCATYTFCYGASPLTNSPVNPIPLVSYIKKTGNVLELHGENFNTLLTVWFDDVPAETMYRCEELLMCLPPHISAINHNSDTFCRTKKTVQLHLVRLDGIIFKTGLTYTYEVDRIELLREEVARRLAEGEAMANALPANSSKQMNGSNETAV